MNGFNEFVAMFLSSASVIGAVALFSKSIVSYFLSATIEIKKLELAQNLESYRQTIQKENSEFQHGLSERLQEHKGRLEQINYEYNTRFSRLHQERADVIKIVYKHLMKLQAAMFTFTRTMHPIYEDAAKEEKERLDNVNDAFAELADCYGPNKIFLSKSLCEKIDHIFFEYRDKGWDFAQTQRMFKEQSIPREAYRLEIDKANKISDSIKDEMPPLINELEAEFRNLLGVIN